ncbi:MAG: hypothetical protein QXH96_00655 [Candidatus Geothermarchaeota archaeon]
MKEGVTTIYVGKKNMSYYVNACTKLLEKGNDNIVIEGLGENIKKAVDTANFLRLIYKKGSINIKHISIDLIDAGTIRGLPKKVSRIRIEIEKQG